MSSYMLNLLSQPNMHTSGFGHNNVAFHEWTAASVFYGLLQPIAEEISHEQDGSLPAELISELSKAAHAINEPPPETPITFKCDGSRFDDKGFGMMLCHLANSTVTL
jgi:hypothetical protein